MNWRELLEDAIRRAGPGRLKDVAAALGYSKSSLSLARHGAYPGSTKRIEAAVLRVYGRVQCPHLGQEISPQECAELADRPCPTSSADALQHWSACQKCPFNVAKGKS